MPGRIIVYTKWSISSRSIVSINLW